MTLAAEFDAVLMLTSSDWKTEPRSNRYHFATRFAKFLPVLFLQHASENRERIRVEETQIENLDLVHVECGVGMEQVLDVIRLLNARGIKRPLLWIYDPKDYLALIDAMPGAFRVYHATEDYFTASVGFTVDTKTLGPAVARLLGKVDYLVACSEGVAQSCLTEGGYSGAYAVVENGCDGEFYLEILAHCGSGVANGRPIAIFQGGINLRLDYELLIGLAASMTDWDFEFCGRALLNKQWEVLKAFPNVKYHGDLPPEAVGELMSRATVGLIPFIQDKYILQSLPLKAYEYVACGLPVVSVPITALERESTLFSIQTTVAGFAAAIRTVAETRFDVGLLAKRREAALANSYNRRFEAMVGGLLTARGRARCAKARAAVAVLYDGMNSLHVSTIREHLEAFGEYSRHDITFISAAAGYWQRGPAELSTLLDFAVFDAVIVHPSVRLSVPGHLDEGIVRVLERYHGLKMLFIQDEHENVEISRALMERLQFNVVYTCVPETSVGKVYPAYRFPATEFLPTLTGYVPEDATLEQHALPLAERKLAIAYRGRELPLIYGELGYEQYRIGMEMKALASRRNIPVDIELDDSKRIDGADGYKFLGSARATLGTESGSNVFDVDGTLKNRIAQRLKQRPDDSPREVAAEILASHEGQIKMNQVSPKIFEAIRLRTALILFEGEYSDAVRPNEHFIPLRKDFSNIDEVFEKLGDDLFLTQMTERAYRDVVASGRYSYRRFVEGVDVDIGSRVYRRMPANRLRGPQLLVGDDGTIREALPAMPAGVWRGVHPLGRPLLLTEIANWQKGAEQALVGPIGPAEQNVLGQLRVTVFRVARWGWRRMPQWLQAKILVLARRALMHLSIIGASSTLLFRATRWAWHCLPRNTRIRLARMLARH
jgi:hypothetical protein